MLICRYKSYQISDFKKTLLKVNEVFFLSNLRIIKTSFENIYLSSSTKMYYNPKVVSITVTLLLEL